MYVEGQIFRRTGFPFVKKLKSMQKSKGVFYKLEKPKVNQSAYTYAGTMHAMAIRVVEFSSGGYKIRNIFA